MAEPNNEGFINWRRTPVLVITLEHVDKAINFFGYLSIINGVLSQDTHVLACLAFLFFCLSSILVSIHYSQGPVEFLGLNAFTLLKVAGNLAMFFIVSARVEQHLDRFPPPTPT